MLNPALPLRVMTAHHCCNTLANWLLVPACLFLHACSCMLVPACLFLHACSCMLCTSPSFETGVVTGQGDSFVANVPRPLPTLAALGIVQVACGESHNAALTIHGRVFTWGRGKYGALGLGTFNSSSWPQHVAALQEPACQVTTPSLACLQLLVNVMLISAV